MREILFKAKCKDTGEWMEGFPVRIYDYGGLVWEMHPFETNFNISRYVIPSTISQFTGLKDKNGKKIFEGDIVIIRNCKEHPVLVSFVDFSWQCIIPNNNAYIHYRHRLEDNITKYEVIGNIHDNPELLE